MSMEIERKFLVDGEKVRLLFPLPSLKIMQGYILSSPDLTIRVRSQDDKGILTIKGKTQGISRKEIEKELSPDEMNFLLTQCPIALKKTRYLYLYQGKKWEIDFFHEGLEGLILAEVELESENEQIELPDFVTQEVSDDPQYFNANIIQRLAKA